VAGVLNGALVPAEELAKFPDGWNGRPIPVYHPTKNGQNISANWPDVLERCVGQVFNTQFDTDRLRAEFWLDEQRMDNLGMAPLLGEIQAGKMFEVSTGYYCDSVAVVGEFNGKPYIARHANLRPDHVALLPDQIGACSIADGCGAPRVNTSRASAVKTELVKALNAIGVALGIKTNCSCEEPNMKAANIATLAATLIANGADLAGVKALANLQTNFDVAELEKMSEAGRAALYGALKALDKAAAKAAAADDAGAGDDDEPPAANEGDDDEPKANARKGGKGMVTMSVADLEKLIDRRVARGVKAVTADVVAHTRKAEVVERIVANQSNAFTKAELEAMSLDSLTKYEGSIRPTDYSGAVGGGVAQFSTNEAAPLVAPQALLAPRKAN
jgi:hypothetical protein